MIAGVSRGAASLAVFCTLLGQPPPPVRVFFGDSAHPVVSGEVWLVAHEWGYYPAVLVATIRNGTLAQVPESEPIKGAAQASEYKLLVAISDRPLRPRDVRRTDHAYGAGQPEFIKEFAYLYLSDPLSNERQGRDWPAALNRMGVTADGQTLNTSTHTLEWTSVGASSYQVTLFNRTYSSTDLLINVAGDTKAAFSRRLISRANSFSLIDS